MLRVKLSFCMVICQIYVKHVHVNSYYANEWMTGWMKFFLDEFSVLPLKHLVNFMPINIWGMNLLRGHEIHDPFKSEMYSLTDFKYKSSKQ